MVTVATALKGTAIIRRIDQYMPRHTDVPATALLGTASLQSGQAERSAGSRTAATAAISTAFGIGVRIVIPANLPPVESPRRG